MLERILDAGQQVLVDHGYDGTSTNRIAAAAGISPGSLYQYFPNKDAIMSAILDRFSDTLTSRVTEHLSGQFDQPPPVVIRTTLAELLDALDVHPELQRAAVEHAPRLDDGRRLREFEQRVGDLATAYLTARRDILPTDDVPISATAWMIVRTVEHLTVRYLLDRPALTRDQFLDELTRLTLNYLRPPT